MDPDETKRALRFLDYNLAVIGVREREVQDVAEDLNAFIGSWITQTSFDPPLLAVGVSKKGRSRAMIEESGVFTVNVLAADQKDVAVRFFKDLEVTPEAMGGVPYVRGVTGAPSFPSFPAWFECEVRHTWDGGDHALFVGEVVAAGAKPKDALGEPLKYSNTGWKY